MGGLGLGGHGGGHGGGRGGGGSGLSGGGGGGGGGGGELTFWAIFGPLLSDHSNDSKPFNHPADTSPGSINLARDPCQPVQSEAMHCAGKGQVATLSPAKRAAREGWLPLLVSGWWSNGSHKAYGNNGSQKPCRNRLVLIILRAHWSCTFGKSISSAGR